MISKMFSFDLVNKLDFDPDPESDPEMPLKSDPDPEFPSKSRPDPEIIFSDPTQCFRLNKHGEKATFTSYPPSPSNLPKSAWQSCQIFIYIVSTFKISSLRQLQVLFGQWCESETLFVRITIRIAFALRYFDKTFQSISDVVPFYIRH